MVSSVLFYQVHQSLNEIFGSTTELLFAELAVLVCRDLHQLPSVKGTNILQYRQYESIFRRQQGDYEFVSLLNKIRVGIVDDKVEKLSKPRFVTKDDLLYPKHAVHMFAGNCPFVDYNELMLNEIDGQTISLSAIDDIPYEVQLSDKQLETIKARKTGDTGNLANVLKLKIGVQLC